MNPLVVFLIMISIIGLAPSHAWAQEAAAAGDNENLSPGLLVFLDCERRTCDQNYLRREITFINYVRDRQDAQIHILVTNQAAGSGQEYRFNFIGLREFEGDDTQQVWVSSNTNTDDEKRAGIAQRIRVGILHYLAKTSLIDHIEIRQQIEDIEDRFLVVDPDDDPWDFWVFRLHTDGELKGEDRRSEKKMNFSASASRTTPDWKIRNNANYRYDERKFVLNDGSESVGMSRFWWFQHQTVKSFGEHWGFSGKMAVGHMTYMNNRLAIVGAPGIEYNIFPYNESSRRIFTFTYEIGIGRYQYFEETLFGKTEETLYDHTLLVNADAVQPWGEVEIGVELAQYLSDLDQWQAEVEGRLEFRIFRGLSVNLSGKWAAVRNQRFLPAMGQTDEQILLRQSALATDSRYEMKAGITYQFGSIFNNVVNPRFLTRWGQ
tara:strand:- start:826 stop:2124 length:1299 start_codon:yes stop_codon:yes gene_type:complete